MWHVHWNNHQTLAKVHAFCHRVLQNLLTFNGHLDATNNHKYMKFGAVITKYLINIMVIACLKVWIINTSKIHSQKILLPLNRSLGMHTLDQAKFCHKFLPPFTLQLRMPSRNIITLEGYIFPPRMGTQQQFIFYHKHMAIPNIVVGCTCMTLIPPKRYHISYDNDTWLHSHRKYASTGSWWWWWWSVGWQCCCLINP